MQSENRFFDDLAKVAGGALSALGSLKQEIETLVRDRVERFMADNKMVPREEFEVVKAMAAEARLQQERLAARLAVLEKELDGEKAAAAVLKTSVGTPKNTGFCGQTATFDDLGATPRNPSPFCVAAPHPLLYLEFYRQWILGVWRSVRASGVEGKS